MDPSNFCQLQSWHTPTGKWLLSLTSLPNGKYIYFLYWFLLSNFFWNTEELRYQIMDLHG